MKLDWNGSRTRNVSFSRSSNTVEVTTIFGSYQKVSV